MRPRRSHAPRQPGEPEETRVVGLRSAATRPARLRIACVPSATELAQASHAELAASNAFVPPEESDVILALGGDGHMLHVLHRFLPLRRPIFGMNCGTVGFLTNAYGPGDLHERVRAAQAFALHPLSVKATTAAGQLAEAVAFNEVTLVRHTGQSANVRLSVDGVERIARFVGDGLIVATAAGSTAYNLSAHGPIIPLGSNLIALTPVSPFRPRRWRGALLPDSAAITLENLDPGKRPLTATADVKEIADVVSMAVRVDTSVSVALLFDPGHSLQDRIAAEQFAS